ncbi:MAG: pitrilysin family protein [Gammaproteobacteria bacterium]|nr:pitrilysin family protein [Gammaproteobacteria bacterium]
MYRGLWPVWLLMMLFAGGAAAQAGAGEPAPEVSETVLDNGLRVLVLPDTRAPVVVSQIWYKVGSSYEPEGLTGISHVLEHMMFKGTENLEPNEFSRIIANNGGRENAFTGRDYTAYFEQLEKSRLPIAFELEAERMHRLKLDPAEFRKEVQVVLEERRLRTDDKPESLTYEKFRATAFQRSRYGNPVIGWPEDLRSLTVADLEDWYERFYSPSNATLVVVGDVVPGEVFALAEKHFGPIPETDVRPHPDPREQAQEEKRTVTVEAPATVPYILIGYHVPNLGSPDAEPWEPYALEVLAYLLDGGKTARLSRDLVRGEQVAASAGAGYDAAARMDTQFLLAGNPAGGRTIDELRRGLLSVVEDVKSEPVSAEELERVKVQLVAGKVFETDSIFYQAMRLGMFETNGHGWEAAQTFNDRLREVTAAQVQAVAKKYLVESNMTEAVLEPTGMQEAGQ